MPTPFLLCHFWNRKSLLAFALCSGAAVSKTLVSLGLHIAIDLGTESSGGMADIDILSHYQPLSIITNAFPQPFFLLFPYQFSYSVSRSTLTLQCSSTAFVESRRVFVWVCTRYVSWIEREALVSGCMDNLHDAEKGR